MEEELEFSAYMDIDDVEVMLIISSKDNRILRYIITDLEGLEQEVLRNLCEDENESRNEISVEEMSKIEIENKAATKEEEIPPNPPITLPNAVVSTVPVPNPIVGSACKTVEKAIKSNSVPCAGYHPFTGIGDKVLMCEYCIHYSYCYSGKGMV